MVLIDKHCNQQVLGSIIHNPLLLAEYDINPKVDFEGNKIGALIFVSIKNLLAVGAKSLSVIEIDQDISHYEAWAASYEKENGLEYLKGAYEIAQPENFKYYYTRMKKLALLRRLKKEKFDISYFYKEDFNSLREENETIARFEEASIEDILNKVEGKFNLIRQEYINGEEKQEKAAVGIDELIDELLETPEVGVPLNGEYWDNCVSGARLGKYYIRSASSGTGKAIPDYTLIPTPEGMRKVGDIRPGDYLFGQDGQPTKVLMIHPQSEEKEIWEIVFKDGRVAECCEEHLWQYRTYSQRKTTPDKVGTTRELFEYANKIGDFQNNDGQFRLKIKVNKPVSFSKKEYTLPPYVMGAFLGDASFRYTKKQKALTFSSGDEEIPNKIGLLLGLVPKKNSGDNFNYTFKKTLGDRHNYWVEELLKDYPELWNVKSEDKFIPKNYLYGSIEQRFELLQGLMDTDGYINKNKGRTQFTTISEKLKNDFIFLCRSLGFIVTVCEDKRTEKYVTGVAYNIQIQANKEDKIKLFSLQRKKKIALDYLNNNKRAESRDYNPVVAIRKTERKTKMTCFTVDNNSHLFLMNDFIVTHNTRLAVKDALKICYPIHWDFDKNNFTAEMDENGEIRQPENVLVVTTELDRTEIMTLCLAFLSGVNESHILRGDYLLGELERVRFAAKIMKKYEDHFFLGEIPDPSIGKVESLLRKHIVINKVKYIFYDYIFSSPSLIGEFEKSGLREDVVLTMLSTKLKEIAKEYNVFIETATQVNAQAMDSEGFKNETCVRGSKGVADKCDIGVVALKVETKEYNSLMVSLKEAGILPKPDCIPTHRFDLYKSRRTPYKNVSIYSMINLGTGQWKDLYVVTASGKVLKDFTIYRNTTYTEQIFNWEGEN